MIIEFINVCFSMNRDVYKDEDFDEDENDEFCIPLTCLFCSTSANNLTDINNHMKVLSICCICQMLILNLF